RSYGSAATGPDRAELRWSPSGSPWAGQQYSLRRSSRGGTPAAKTPLTRVAGEAGIRTEADAGDRAAVGRYRAAVRIATWNVNPVNQRLPRLLPWLDERKPD